MSEGFAGSQLLLRIPGSELRTSNSSSQVELVNCSPITSVTCKAWAVSNTALDKTDLFVFVSLRHHHNLQSPGHIWQFAACLGKITIVSIISTNGERKVLARHPHESLYWLQQCFNSRQDHSGVTAISIRNFASLNLHTSLTLFYSLASSERHTQESCRVFRYQSACCVTGMLTPCSASGCCGAPTIGSCNHKLLTRESQPA